MWSKQKKMNFFHVLGVHCQVRDTLFLENKCFSRDMGLLMLLDFYGTKTFQHEIIDECVMLPDVRLVHGFMTLKLGKLG